MRCKQFRSSGTAIANNTGRKGKATHLENMGRTTQRRKQQRMEQHCHRLERKQQFFCSEKRHQFA